MFISNLNHDLAPPIDSKNDWHSENVYAVRQVILMLTESCACLHVQCKALVRI